jgi:hypothetical protein
MTDRNGRGVMPATGGAKVACIHIVLFAFSQFLFWFQLVRVGTGRYHAIRTFIPKNNAFVPIFRHFIPFVFVLFDSIIHFIKSIFKSVWRV